MKNDINYDLTFKEVWYSIRSMYSKIAKEQGISESMAFILLNIKKTGSSSTEISSRVGLEVHSLTRHLQNIQSCGFAKKVTDQNDKRVQRYFLTKEGVKARRKAAEIIFQFNDRVNQSLSKEEQLHFEKIIIKVQIAIKDFRSQFSD